MSPDRGLDDGPVDRMVRLTVAVIVVPLDVEPGGAVQGVDQTKIFVRDARADQIAPGPQRKRRDRAGVPAGSADLGQSCFGAEVGRDGEDSPAVGVFDRYGDAGV